MRLLRIDGGETVEVEQEDYIEEKKSVLFLGGLLHTNRVSLEGGLPKLLQDLCGEVPIYIAYDDTLPGVPAIADDMNQFIATGEISDYGQDIGQLIYAKISGRDYSDATDVLSGVRLLGYSYGCSVIQQAAQVLADKVLDDCKAQQNVQFPVEYTYSLLNNISAINIGPTTHLFDYGVDGQHATINNLQETSGEERLLFTQRFFVNDVDKIVQMIAGEYYSENENLGIFYDPYADSYLRRVGVERLASGTVFPKIKYEFDFEGHHIGLYTNVYSEEGGQVTYPSSCQAQTLRDSILNLSGEGLITSKNPISSPQKIQFLTLKEEFSRFLCEYECAKAPDLVATIEALTSKCFRSRSSSAGLQKLCL